MPFSAKPASRRPNFPDYNPDPLQSYNRQASGKEWTTSPGGKAEIGVFALLARLLRNLKGPAIEIIRPVF